MKQGLDADIESMTQAQKTMLRYQYVMSAAQSAMTDFQRTQSSWHNQVTILKESIKALGVVIGQGLINALKPALKGFNTFLSSTIDFAQNVLNALGKIFGWEYEITGGGIADDTLADVAEMATDLGDATGGADSLGDSIGDVGDGIDEATKAADKLKNTILGFDELNVLNDVADALDDIAGNGGSGTGSGSGTGTGTGGTDSGIGGGGGSNPIQVLAKKTKSAFESNIDNLYDLGKYISDSLKKALDDIEWNKVYEKARNFGKGLAQFLNGLIQPETFYSVGRTLANSLNTVVEAALAFTREFDWKKAGKSLEQGFIGLFKNINWTNIYALADELGRNLAIYLNNLFTPELFSEAGRTLANSLNTVFHFLDNFGQKFEWEQFGKSLSEGLASFIGNIRWEEALSAAKEWGTGIATALNSFIESGDENKWREVGRTVGNAVKTGIIAVISLTDEIHWDEVGHAVSDVINGALDNISGEDVAEAINGLVEGLNEAIGICKDNGTFDRIGDEIGDAIKNIHWDSVTELLVNSAMLDLAVGMATGLAGWFGQNPVKGILEGGVGIMGNILSMAIAMKIAGVGTVGGGSAAATASAAGTAISTSLAGGIIVGGVAVAAAGLIIAGIVSAATYQWKDESVHGMATMGEEIAVRLGLISENWLRENKRVTDGEELMYRDLLNQAREHGYEKATIWDETTGKLYQITEDANGKIEKKEVELWNNTDSVFSSGQQKAVGHVKELWDANANTTTSGTQNALDLIRGYSNTHANEFNAMKEGVVGTTQDMWASAAETTGTYTAQIESDVESSTSNVLSSAETNLGQLPGIFDSYFGQGTDNALWHLGNFESSASSILSNVTSWLYDAINTANQASSISVGPVAHWGGHYAEGGFPDSGTLFMARENASPEMVGRIGTRTAVANNDQIVAGIRAGVMDGMMQVLTATSSGGGSQPIVNEITVTCGEETLYQAVVRGKEKHDRRFQTVATIG